MVSRLTKEKKDELCCALATALLHDGGVAVTADSVKKVLASTKNTVEPYWPSLFAKMATTRNVDELICGDSGAAEEEQAAAATSLRGADEDEY